MSTDSEVRPLLAWVVPTRGYRACAVGVAVAGTLALGGWLGWAVVAGELTRPGWAVWSLLCTLAAAVVSVGFGWRPQPRAYRPRAGSLPLRAVGAGERRMVRRAVRAAVPPQSRRLALIAAKRLENMASNIVLPAVYLFAAAVYAARAATTDAAGAGWWSGLVWALGGAWLFGVVGWARRQAARLDQAWRDVRQAVS